MRKIESYFIASPAATSRLPSTDIHAILPRRATSMTAPGISPSSMCFCVTSSSRFSCVEERPTSSGFDAIGRMPSSACAADAANNSATTLMDFFMAPSSREDLRQLRTARGLPPEGPGPSSTDVSEIEILDHAPVALGIAHDESPAARHGLGRHPEEAAHAQTGSFRINPWKMCNVPGAFLVVACADKAREAGCDLPLRVGGGARRSRWTRNHFSTSPCFDASAHAS